MRLAPFLPCDAIGDKGARRAELRGDCTKITTSPTRCPLLKAADPSPRTGARNAREQPGRLPLRHLQPCVFNGPFWGRQPANQTQAGARILVHKAVGGPRRCTAPAGATDEIEGVRTTSNGNRGSPASVHQSSPGKGRLGTSPGLVTQHAGLAWDSVGSHAHSPLIAHGWLWMAWQVNWVYMQVATGVAPAGL